MSPCDIDSTTNATWTINTSILGCPKNKSNKNIYMSLFDPYEWAGRFGMKVKPNGEIKSFLDKLNRGSATSVKTTDGFCNFHTHPFSCYAGEQTMWGWPSGEDMRETVGFMLKNNLFHLVFTLEGIYMLQVNPNFLKIIHDDNKLSKTVKDLKGNFISPNEVRGIIISLIESYFKATHGHRGIQYNILNRHKENRKSKNKLSSQYWGICMPEDWVHFANQFKLSNLVDKNNYCSKLLPCNSFPDYETKIGTIPLSEYLKNYGIEVYQMSKNGRIKGSSHSEMKYYRMIQKNIKNIINIFESEPNTISYGDEEWKPGQWFNVKLFYNEFEEENGKYINFFDWMKNCKKKEIQTNEPIQKIIHNFWENCQKNKKGFRFPIGNKIQVRFKKLVPKKGKKTCTAKHGKHIHEFIKSKRKTNINHYKR